MLTLGGTALNVVFSGIVAATHPSQYIAKLSFASAAVGLTIVPYTFGIIMPVNRELLGLAKSIDANTLADTDEARRVDELITRWDTLHKVRFLAYAGAWLLSMAALVCDTRVLVDVVDVVYA